MTKPTIVFFGFDVVPKPCPKVFLRTLLYSSSAKGHVVEGMHAVVRYNSVGREFRFWGYADRDKISPGSGLYISKTGLAANHHFVLSINEDAYEFQPGSYEIDVIAEVVGRKKRFKLGTIKLDLSDSLAAVLAKHEGVLFERISEGQYEGSVRD